MCPFINFFKKSFLVYIIHHNFALTYFLTELLYHMSRTRYLFIALFIFIRELHHFTGILSFVKKNAAVKIALLFPLTCFDFHTRRAKFHHFSLRKLPLPFVNHYCIFFALSFCFPRSLLFQSSH